MRRTLRVEFSSHKCYYASEPSMLTSVAENETLRSTTKRNSAKIQTATETVKTTSTNTMAKNIGVTSKAPMSDE